MFKTDAVEKESYETTTQRSAAPPLSTPMLAISGGESLYEAVELASCGEAYHIYFWRELKGFYTWIPITFRRGVCQGEPEAYHFQVGRARGESRGTC